MATRASAAGEREDGTQADEAYRAIRLSILHCDLPPGERVSELQLANQFGFGRAAVRTALGRLHHEQLVDSMPRHGYTIAPVTFTHVQDLYGARLVVEPAVARLTAERANPALVADLERLNRACRFSPGRDDLTAVRDANKAFHAAVGRGSSNERLTRISVELMDELDRILYLPQLAPLWNRLDTTYIEHERIVDAIRARDTDAAEDAARDHVLKNRRSAVDALIASPGVRALNLLEK
jgi:DNA-binding GntR family transcriptional regulator